MMIHAESSSPFFDFIYSLTTIEFILLFILSVLGLACVFLFVIAPAVSWIIDRIPVKQKVTQISPMTDVMKPILTSHVGNWYDENNKKYYYHYVPKPVKFKSNGYMLTACARGVQKRKDLRVDRMCILCENTRILVESLNPIDIYGTPISANDIRRMFGYEESFYDFDYLNTKTPYDIYARNRT